MCLKAEGNGDPRQAVVAPGTRQNGFAPAKMDVTVAVIKTGSMGGMKMSLRPFHRRRYS